MSRALVSVWNHEQEGSQSGNVTLPAVFTAPIRHDLVHYVHSLMAKNARQPYAVTRRAGMMVSWLLSLNLELDWRMPLALGCL
jgi:large subunit ribosomal protein L4e